MMQTDELVNYDGVVLWLKRLIYDNWKQMNFIKMKVTQKRIDELNKNIYKLWYLWRENQNKDKIMMIKQIKENKIYI